MPCSDSPAARYDGSLGALLTGVPAASVSMGRKP
jgi:hypothetical protein